MKTFETRAFSLIRGPIWVFFLFLFLFCLFLWVQYFLNALKPSIEPMLFAITAISAPLFIFASMASFPKIRIEKDGIFLSTGFSSFLFSFDEVKKVKNGYILKVGNWLIGDICIPFKRKETLEILEGIRISQPAISKKRSLTYIIYLLPPVLLHLVSFSLKTLNIAVHPVLWAIIWGIMVAVSLSLFTYKSPMTVKIWTFDKKSSSAILGIAVGISIFLFLLLTL